MWKAFLKNLLRRRAPISFADAGCLEPASRHFGLDRGSLIDRYYIERFLRQRADLIQGEVLEIGGDEYTRRFGGKEVSRSLVLAAPGSEPRHGVLIGDLTDSATLPAGTVDCFICTQTLNFIYDVDGAVRGAHHLLKPGGVLLATVAGISQISRYDMDRWGDYWRFTTASLRRLVETVFGGTVTIESYGNLPVSLAFLQGLSVEDLPDPALLDVADADYQLVISVVARKQAL